MTPKLRLNPSSAHTWTECTAQPHYVRQFAHMLPPNDTEFNREGTIAHAVVEHRFKEPGKEYKAKGVKPEMHKHAEGFHRFCKALLGDWVEWWSEKKVSLFYAPESHGYIDFCGFKEDGSLVIVDYKYGQGVAVNAKENLQMAIYATSLLSEMLPGVDPYLEVTMAIYQPRVRQGEPTSTWTLQRGELIQFVQERVGIPAADIRAKALTLKFSPGPKVCQFCPAAGFCGMEGYEPDFPYSGKMRVQSLLDDTPLEPLKTGLPARLRDAKELPMDVLARVVRQKSEIEKWLEKVKELALAMLTDGKPVEGLKLVKGKGGHRAWRNEEDVREILLKHCDREDVIIEKLISPAQADQLEHDLPKEEWSMVQKLVFKPEGGPVVAPSDDPRPPYVSSVAAEYFEEEEDWI